jgi:8-oxo-dGTP pyrophosphatase MutT (NUDIX family)
MSGDHDTLVTFTAAEHGSADHILVVAQHDAAVILVRSRCRDRWELPGGELEPGDDAAARAATELREETGQRAAGLRACGTAIIRDAESGATRCGRVFACRVDDLAPFRANGETLGIALWRGEPCEDIDRAALAIIERCGVVAASSLL